MSEQFDEIFEGITNKTKKDEVLERLRKARQLAELAVAVQTISRVRRKWAGRPTSNVYHTVVTTATEQEWLESIEFLTDLRDVCPAPLARLAEAGRVMFDLDEENHD